MDNNLSLIPLEGEAFTDKEMAVFEEKYMPVIRDYAHVVKMKKSFEEKEKKFKKDLGKAMDELGIKSFDCPFVKFIRVAGSEDKVTIDLDALKDKEPELYQELLEDYPKKTKGKSSTVRFDVK